MFEAWPGAPGIGGVHGYPSTPKQRVEAREERALSFRVGLAWSSQEAPALERGVSAEAIRRRMVSPGWRPPSDGAPPARLSDGAVLLR